MTSSSGIYSASLLRSQTYSIQISLVFMKSSIRGLWQLLRHLWMILYCRTFHLGRVRMSRQVRSKLRSLERVNFLSPHKIDPPNEKKLSFSIVRLKPWMNWSDNPYRMSNLEPRDRSLQLKRWAMRIWGYSLVKWDTIPVSVRKTWIVAHRQREAPVIR